MMFEYTNEIITRRKFLICKKIKGKWYFLTSRLVKLRRYTICEADITGAYCSRHKWKIESVLS